MGLQKSSSLKERFRSTNQVHLVTTNLILPKTREKEVLMAVDTVETRGREATRGTGIAGRDQGAEAVQGEEILETREVAGLPEEAEIATLQIEDLVTCIETVKGIDPEETTQDQTEPHPTAKGLKSEGTGPKADTRTESALTETTDPPASGQPRSRVQARTKIKRPLLAAKTPTQNSLNSRKRYATATNSGLS